MKKRRFTFAAVFVLLAALLLAGCDNGSTSDDEIPPGGEEPGGEEPGEPDIKDVAYTVIAADGILHRKDTTGLLFAFDKEGEAFSLPAGALSLADISVTDGTGSVTALLLSDSEGPNRTLSIAVITEGTVRVKITKEGISDAEKIVSVYKNIVFQEDASVTIADIVNVGAAPSLPADTGIIFGLNEGAPVAALPPRTYDPVSVMNAESYGLQHVIAEFDPPLDLTTTADSEFRWFELVWDNFGTSWDFATESTEGSYTGTVWYLHNVRFQLDLETSEGETVRLQATSETNTSTNEKKPVSFHNYDIVESADTVSWGAGHLITSITLRVIGVQLRSPGNSAWPDLSPDRNPSFEDMWIRSLTVNTSLSAPVKTLYSLAGGWSDEIINPRYAHNDSAFNGGTALDAAGGMVFDTLDGEKNIVSWNPIDISVEPGTGAPYATIVVMYTCPSALIWYGYGSICLEGTSRRTQMYWDGTASADTMRIPLTVGDAYFNENQFVGFFFQTDFKPDRVDVTVTEIRLE
ncbi:MAG: hypothetical protein FWH38_00345 [Treponema sp.]|nr:hypothetical protein [Treponema sp.]